MKELFDALEVIVRNMGALSNNNDQSYIDSCTRECFEAIDKARAANGVPNG